MALLVGALLLAGVSWLIWKGTDRNRGTVEQQSVDPRHPFEN